MTSSEPVQRQLFVFSKYKYVKIIHDNKTWVRGALPTAHIIWNSILSATVLCFFFMLLNV